MKIGLTRKYTMYEVYGTMEIDPNEHPELEGMSEDEVIEYLNENMYEFNVNDSMEDNLHDEIMFNYSIIKDKELDSEDTIIKFS